VPAVAGELGEGQVEPAGDPGPVPMEAQK
jgi:hypothetical protein